MLNSTRPKADCHTEQEVFSNYFCTLEEQLSLVDNLLSLYCQRPFLRLLFQGKMKSKEEFKFYA